MRRNEITVIADKYAPKIYRNGGKLKSDVANHQCRKALRYLLRICTEIACNPYGGEVRALGNEEPFAVGQKTAAAISDLGKRPRNNRP